jgi:hypothetical protein
MRSSPEVGAAVCARWSATDRTLTVQRSSTPYWVTTPTPGSIPCVPTRRSTVQAQGQPVPVVARVRPTSRRAQSPSSTECHSGSRPRGTACAGSSAARPGYAADSGPGQRPAVAHQQRPCGPGWPSDQHAQGWCGGCGGPAGRPGGPAAVGLVPGQMLGTHPGPATATRPGHPHGVHQPDQLGGVGVLPGREPGGQVPATPVADRVELGGQPTP